MHPNRDLLTATCSRPAHDLLTCSRSCSDDLLSWTPPPKGGGPMSRSATPNHHHEQVDHRPHPHLARTNPRPPRPPRPASEAAR